MQQPDHKDLNLNKVLIILPTYNESENIERMIHTLNANYRGVHLLVIDDNSPDKTADLVELNLKKIPTLSLIKNKFKSGLGSAYVQGIKWATSQNKFEYIITMDSDFSHRPVDLQKILDKLDPNHLVIGSRYVSHEGSVKGWPLKRRILSKLGAWYTRIFTFMPVSDPTGGFNAYYLNWFKEINIENIISQGYMFQIEMKFKFWRAGKKVIEVPITFVERELGKSKLGKGVVWEAITRVPFLWFRAK